MKMKAGRYNRIKTVMDCTFFIVPLYKSEKCRQSGPIKAHEAQKIQSQVSATCAETTILLTAPSNCQHAAQKVSRVKIHTILFLGRKTEM